METINFHMKEKEAAWKEQRRQIANDLNYEETQARRKCEADIEQARRKYHERIKATAREEDEYKHQERLAKDELRKSKLAELERMVELEERIGKEAGNE